MNHKDELPCLKCILLAMCKHKRGVTCDMIHEYNGSKDGLRFEEINEVLPNLQVIIPSDDRGMRYMKGVTIKVYDQFGNEYKDGLLWL